MDDLIHIRVSKRLKKEMRKLIDAGLFSNQTEVVRESVRDLLLKYKDHLRKEKDEDNK